MDEARFELALSVLQTATLPLELFVRNAESVRIELTWAKPNHCLASRYITTLSTLRLAKRKRLKRDKELMQYFLFSLYSSLSLSFFYVTIFITTIKLYLRRTLVHFVRYAATIISHSLSIITTAQRKGLEPLDLLQPTVFKTASSTSRALSFV